MPTQTLLMHLGALQPDSVISLHPSFDELTPSRYKDGEYRLRRYSKICFDHGRVSVLPAEAFVQSGDINEFQGDVVRVYDNLSDQALHSQGMAQICQSFIDACELPSVCQIEIHQMRIIAKQDSAPAESAPEGIHQDGFDYVGVFTIQRYNQSGGELMIWRDKQSPKPVSTLTPKAGEYCIVNDRTLWHSASAVAVGDQDQVGYWDLLVLTANNPNLSSD